MPSIVAVDVVSEQRSSRIRRFLVYWLRLSTTTGERYVFPGTESSETRQRLRQLALERYIANPSPSPFQVSYRDYWSWGFFLGMMTSLFILLMGLTLTIVPAPIEIFLDRSSEKLIMTEKNWAVAPPLYYRLED